MRWQPRSSRTRTTPVPSALAVAIARRSMVAPSRRASDSAASARRSGVGSAGTGPGSTSAGLDPPTRSGSTSRKPGSGFDAYATTTSSAPRPASLFTRTGATCPSHESTASVPATL